MNKRIRKLTEGAIITAIVGMIMIINRMGLGFFEQYLSWLMPLPLLVYSSKYGLKASLLPYVAIIFVSIMFALPSSSIFVAMTGITGIVYGSGVYRNKNNFWLLRNTIILTTITYVLTMVVFAQFFGYDVLTEVNAIITFIEGFKGPVWLSTDVIRIAIAVMILMTAVMESLIVHILAHFLLPRINIKVDQLKNLTDIRLSKTYGYVFIGLIIAQITAYQLDFPLIIKETLITLGYIAELVFCIFGLIVIIIYSRVSRKIYILLIVVALLLVIPQVVFIVLMIIGIIDIFTDYRKLMIGWLKNGTK